ncbi:hypothetical protein [Nostoc sphaeroides]|uniref:Uncharacterized protein n=1 Tax=Nostoc sphaeroides CCNUC1 TaxID=2653204 RepID=A0A5P8WJY4_9NOSO|nr:hypothetical protein [Nostoc sphaeroides]QFS52881.1 hypothetical protein GXM_10145 [Nostoc sphaeroides CCNUC1]
MTYPNTGVPLLYVSLAGLHTPSFTSRSHDNNQRNNHFVNNYIVIGCGSSYKRFEQAYSRVNTANTSLYNSSAIAFGGAA